MEFVALIRKFAENPEILPYGLCNAKIVNYGYGYNTWILFIACISKVANVDIIFSWQNTKGIFFILSFSGAYTLVKYLTNNRLAAIFSSIPFFFVIIPTMGIGQRVFLDFFRGHASIPTRIMNTTLVLPALIYFSMALEKGRLRFIVLTALSSFMLFSVHGSGALVYASFYGVFFIIALIFFKKKIRTLRILFMIGFFCFMFNFPYLYFTKLSNKGAVQFRTISEKYNSLEYLKYNKRLVRNNEYKFSSSPFSRTKKYYRDMIFVTDTMFIYHPKLFLQNLVPISGTYLGLIGAIGLILIYYFCRKKIRFWVFCAAALAPPFFILNPFLVTHGRFALWLNQIYRFATRSPFLKLASILSIYLVIYSIGLFLANLLAGKRPILSRRLKISFSFIPFLIIALIYISIINREINGFKLESSSCPGKHYKDILNDSQLVEYRAKVPQNEVITNFKGSMYMPILANHYIAYMHSVSMLIGYLGSYDEGIQKHEELMKMRAFLKALKLKEFTENLRKMNRKYIMVSFSDRKALNNYRPFTDIYEELASCQNLVVYRLKGQNE